MRSIKPIITITPMQSGCMSTTMANTANISSQYISYAPQTNITGQTTYPYNGTKTYNYLSPPTSSYGTNVSQQVFQFDGYSNIYVCNCGTYHTELFNYLSILETEEEFRALFKKVIRMHYKAEDNTTQTIIPGFNAYYADTVSLTAYVKTHFSEYFELLESYLLLK